MPRPQRHAAKVARLRVQENLNTEEESLPTDLHCFENIGWRGDKLHVGPSSLGESTGYGLISAHHFREGDVVTEYSGRFLRRAKSPKDVSYCVPVCDTWMIDGFRNDAGCVGLGSIANDLGDDLNNVRMFCTQGPVPVAISSNNVGGIKDIRTTVRAWLLAIKDIPPGQEVGFDYGKNYWKHWTQKYGDAKK